MKKLLVLFSIIAAISACNNDKKAGGRALTDKPAVDSTLVTDSTWGPITANTDFTGLQKIYGDTNVRDERICGPECIDSLDVTKVFPGTNKEIIVHWKDSAYHKTIGMLQSYLEGHPYHTASGLKSGSTMKDLLRLNGKKITFSGFGWDYGGYITSYNGGALDSVAVRFRLDLTNNSDNSLLGDAEFDTEMPAAKPLLDKIVIYEFSLGFYKE